MITRIARSINHGLETASVILHRIGNVVLMIMMLLTTADVILRLFKIPLLGTFDMTEYMMAILVSFGLAYCSIHKGHVSVDFVMRHLPHRVQDIIGIITTLISCILIAIMSYWSWLQTLTQHGTMITSSVLPIPQYPFVFAVALGLLLLALVLFSEFIKRIAPFVGSQQEQDTMLEVTY